MHSTFLELQCRTKCLNLWKRKPSMVENLGTSAHQLCQIWVRPNDLKETSVHQRTLSSPKVSSGRKGILKYGKHIELHAPCTFGWTLSPPLKELARESEGRGRQWSQASGKQLTAFGIIHSMDPKAGPSVCLIRTRGLPLPEPLQPTVQASCAPWHSSCKSWAKYKTPPDQTWCGQHVQPLNSILTPVYHKENTKYETGQHISHEFLWTFQHHPAKVNYYRGIRWTKCSIEKTSSTDKGKAHTNDNNSCL